MLLILRVFSFLCPQIRFNDVTRPSESEGICSVSSDSRTHNPTVEVASVRLLFQPSVYKQWDEERMQKAIDACTCEGIAIREAAIRFGVPKSTLGDRISGKVPLWDLLVGPSHI